jgi:hypothetical protein
MGLLEVGEFAVSMLVNQQLYLTLMKLFIAVLIRRTCLLPAFHYHHHPNIQKNKLNLINCNTHTFPFRS